MNGIFTGAYEKDENYIRAAIDALSYSEDIDEGTLVRRVYALARTAHTKLGYFSGTPCEILDRVFPEGSSELSGITVFKSADGIGFDKISFEVGDVFVFDCENSSGILIYDGERFRSLSCGGREEKPCFSAGRAALLRPRLSLCDVKFDFQDEELSEAQISLLATAEAYFMRGYRAQYDDTRFTRVGGGEFRWQIGIREPEDYTRDRWGYINCAAFTYELYRCALGIDLGSLYTTFNLMSHYSQCGFTPNEPMYPFYYVPSVAPDEKERARIETDFMSTLRVGDLAIVRRSNKGGHVLMYIGGGRFVHSSGENYNYKEARETHEPTVMVIGAWDYLFDPAAKNYVFSETGYITQLGIVRPLDVFSGEIPENTRNRVKYLRGIFADGEECALCEFPACARFRAGGRRSGLTFCTRFVRLRRNSRCAFLQIGF